MVDIIGHDLGDVDPRAAQDIIAEMEARMAVDLEGDVHQGSVQCEGIGTMGVGEVCTTVSDKMSVVMCGNDFEDDGA